MKKTLTTIIVIQSAVIIFFVICLMHPLGKLIILGIIEPTKHEYDLVTTGNSVFKDNKGNVIGALPAGVILHEPCRHDIEFTDIGDPRIWKLYIDPTNDNTTELVKNRNGSDKRATVLYLGVENHLTK